MLLGLIEIFGLVLISILEGDRLCVIVNYDKIIGRLLVDVSHPLLIFLV